MKTVSKAPPTSVGHDEAPSAEETSLQVAEGAPSPEKIEEWRKESKEQFNELKQQIADVSVRVSHLEEGSSPAIASASSVTFHEAKSVHFDATPSNSVIFEEEEGCVPKTGSPATQRSAMKVTTFNSNASNKRSVIVRSTNLSDKSEDDSSSDSGSVGQYGSIGIGPVRGNSVLLRRPKQGCGSDTMKSVCTIWGQAAIASKLPMPVRIMGTCLGFITVVLLWEFTDGLMKKFCPVNEARLISYLGLSVTAAFLLVLSDQWVRTAAAESGTSSLFPSDRKSVV